MWGPAGGLWGEKTLYYIGYQTKEDSIRDRAPPYPLMPRPSHPSKEAEGESCLDCRAHERQSCLGWGLMLAGHDPLWAVTSTSIKQGPDLDVGSPTEPPGAQGFPGADGRNEWGNPGLFRSPGMARVQGCRQDSRPSQPCRLMRRKRGRRRRRRAARKNQRRRSLTRACWTGGPSTLPPSIP